MGWVVAEALEEEVLVEVQEEATEEVESGLATQPCIGIPLLRQDMDLHQKRRYCKQFCR